MRHTPLTRRVRLIALLAIGFTMGFATPGHAQGFISPLIGYDFSGAAKLDWARASVGVVLAF